MSEPSPQAECPDEYVFMEMLQGVLIDAEREALDAHLDGCPSCTRLVADLAGLLHSGEDASPVGELQIGRYTVREQVGAGGMGVVYEAWDPTLKRKVALKVLRADFIDPQRRSDYSERLLREAQLLASVSHPNILTVYEVMTWEGQVVMVVHFVEGVTLGRWLEVERPGWRAIVDVYMKVGAALAAAHGRGLVHRDVKPANILMERDGRVWLSDFGLACVIGRDVALVSSGDSAEPSVALSALTRTGTVVGTPAYMSPEQHLGAETDSRTDQFSFCAALFEALYGVRPFAGETRHELSMQVCTGTLRDPPPGADVPRGLHAVLARGLARNPEDRYPSMEALLDALGQSTAPRRSRGWIPVAAVASMAALLLVGGGIVVAAWFGGFAPQAATESPAKTSERSRTKPKAKKASKKASKKKASKKKAPRETREAVAEAKREAEAKAAAEIERSEALRDEANERLNVHQRSNALIAEAKRHLAAEEGAACIKALEELRVVSEGVATPYFAATTMVRSQCLMLAGRCAEGTEVLRSYLHEERGEPEVKASKSAKATALKYCR